eukprot:UN1551
MDQLFWAARSHECGCGSQGVPVSKLLSRTQSGHTLIVELVQQALDRRQSLVEAAGVESSWYENAKALQTQILEARPEGFADDHDGVKRNALEVFLAERAIVRRAYQDSNGCCQSCGRQGVCCVRFLLCTMRWLVCSQMTSCVYVLLRCLVCCGCRPLRLALSRCCASRQPTAPLLRDSSLCFSHDAGP